MHLPPNVQLQVFYFQTHLDLISLPPRYSDLQMTCQGQKRAQLSLALGWSCGRRGSGPAVLLSGGLAGGGGRQPGRVRCGDGGDGHWPGSPLLPGGGHSEERGWRERRWSRPTMPLPAARGQQRALEGHGPGMHPPGRFSRRPWCDRRGQASEPRCPCHSGCRHPDFRESGRAWSSDGASELGFGRAPELGLHLFSPRWDRSWDRLC